MIKYIHNFLAIAERRDNMALGTMKSSREIADVLSKVENPATEAQVYYFKGDLIQMGNATKVANMLGISPGFKGGIPYVSSKKDYDKVANYMKLHKVEGYWNYE